MTSVTRAPGSLTVGPLRPVILQLAAPAVAMMACHFCFTCSVETSELVMS